MRFTREYKTSRDGKWKDKPFGTHYFGHVQKKWWLISICIKKMVAYFHLHQITNLHSRHF